MTEEIFRADAYVKSCEAAVTAVTDGGIVLDRTVFYPLGGGQPGDTGVLTTANGTIVAIADTVKEMGTGIHLHVPADGAPSLQVGDRVTAEIDWERRYKHMRIHSCLHLLCAVIEAQLFFAGHSGLSRWFGERVTLHGQIAKGTV